MRRALSALCVLGLAAALAAPAMAAAPSPQRMAAQIKTLQKQVKTLQRQVKALNRDLNTVGNIAVVSLLYSTCETAVTADALQGSNSAFGPTAVTDPSPFTNNATACGDLGRATGTTIARQPNTATVSVFQSLLNIFK